MYRVKREQENPSPQKKTSDEKKVFLMIGGLFWNIRGMSKKGSGPYVRD
jgi:hypothetical protein